ncbi:MAG: methyltransferase domain-containing protein [Hyphomicrobiales bacterium]|nr:methyltransferase domain-containing protein [Hyphomicrobiales bacterium]
MPGVPVIFDRALLARRRARAAAAMASADFLLKEVAADFADRLSLIKRDFARAADIGSHTGLVADAIAALPNVGVVVRSDRCQALIAGQPGPRLVCDEELLPFAPESLNLVVSGLTLQWVNDLPGALAQIAAALKPDGLFLAALLGGDTLYELRQALTAAEIEMRGGASPRVSPFVEVRELGSLLQRAGFALPVTDTDRLTARYADMFELMGELKAMGATNVMSERSRSALPRGVLFRAAEIYAERFAGTDGRIPATFEIVTATGWRPHDSQQRPLRPGSARMRLADALGTREIPAGEKTGPRR